MQQLTPHDGVDQIQAMMWKRNMWKRIPPKDSEPSVKKVYSDGKSKTYHWIPYHLQGGIRLPDEFKRLKSTKEKKDYNMKAIKRENFKSRKQAFIKAKTAYKACISEFSAL
jgi:hypothetical protein